MITINKKLMFGFSFVLCLCTIFCCLQGTILAHADEALQVVDLATTNVYDDLQSCSINGAKFDVSNYPFGEKINTQVLTFVEYCYGADSRSDYGLYVYIYNPKDLDFDLFSESNKISISASSSVTDYIKYRLIFCNKSTGNFENLFLKFKVADELKIAELVAPSSREYKVAEVELFEKGSVNAAAYSVGGTYKYSGFAAGLGVDKNAASTLQCSVEKLQTIELDVHHTYYRTGVSSLGAGHQNQVDSVYFSVPNDILKDYDYLQKVKAEWYEYRTQPIVVIENGSEYNSLVSKVGKTIVAGSTESNNSTSLYSKARRLTAGAYSGVWGYNSNINGFTLQNSYYTLPFLFPTNGLPYSQYNISNDLLNSYIYNYNSSFNNGKLQTKLHNNISYDLFVGAGDIGANRTFDYNCKNIDLRDKFELPSYSENHNWWDTFWDFGFQKPLLDDTYDPVAPIQEVSTTELSAAGASKKFLINSGDVSKVSDYCATSKNAKKTTFLLRFGSTDYYSLPIYSGTSAIEPVEAITKPIGYFAQENVFLDFDIIELTFNKDGVLFVLPVVSSPINGISSPTPPLEDIKPVMPKWLKYVIAAIVLLVVLVIAMPILPYIFKFVIWVVSLPFKFISWCISGFKRGVTNSKVNTKNVKKANTKTIRSTKNDNKRNI